MQKKRFSHLILFTPITLGIFCIHPHVTAAHKIFPHLARAIGMGGLLFAIKAMDKPSPAKNFPPKESKRPKPPSPLEKPTQEPSNIKPKNE